MAEGGHLQENKPGNDKVSTSPCRLLDCPICLEQMLQPKSLPCLHSFCEECLGTYIVTDLSGEMAAATSFPCPVCREITSPVDPSESKETWARQFPANSLIRDANITNEMSETRPLCGFCKRTKNTDIPAKYLCKPDGSLFCDSCKANAHDYFHRVCDIVAIDGKALKQPPSKMCSTHNEILDFYCDDHKFIGCNKCIIAEHRRCEAVMTVKEFCEKQQEHSYLEDIDKSLGKAFDCMELMSKFCDDRDGSMQQTQEVGSKSISDLRQRTNAYLDRKQEEITQELISKHKVEKAKVDLHRQKCNRLKTSIQSTREVSRTAAEKVDHIQMIHLFHRGQTEIGACNDLMDDICSKLVIINHKIDISLETIRQTSTLSLGTIVIDKHPCTLPDGVEYVENIEMLSYGRVRKLKKIDIKAPSDHTDCDARGVLLMLSGDIVVSDYENDCLKLFSSEGQCLHVQTIQGSPRDLCLVDDSTVAVAVSGDQAGIHVLKVLGSVLTPSVVIKAPEINSYYAVAFMDGIFMVSTPKDIYQITFDGKVDKGTTFREDCGQLTCSQKGKSFYASSAASGMDGATVVKVYSGVQTCVMRGGAVKRAMGIDIDSQENLYVCGQASNNVVQISKYGTRIRKLLTSKDGMDKPRAISICGDKFVVTNQSSRDRNYIHIYQLY